VACEQPWDTDLDPGLDPGLDPDLDPKWGADQTGSQGGGYKISLSYKVQKHNHYVFRKECIVLFINYIKVQQHLQDDYIIEIDSLPGQQWIPYTRA
jgi:hypothetical protein